MIQVKARIIVREFSVEVHDGVFLRFVYNVVAALNVAHVETMPFVLLVVKG